MNGVPGTYVHVVNRDSVTKPVFLQDNSAVHAWFRALYRCVNEIFNLLGCYAMLIGRYRRFGTSYKSHLQDSGSPRRLVIWLASFRDNASVSSWTA
jgi:hypothetical protein